MLKDFIVIFIFFYFYDKLLFFITDLYYEYKYCMKNKKGCKNWHCADRYCPYYKYNIYDEDLKSYRPMNKKERKELKK